MSFWKDVDHLDTIQTRVMGMITMSCQDAKALTETCGWMLFRSGKTLGGVLPVVFKHAKVWCREEERGFILRKRKWDEIIVRKNWIFREILKKQFSNNSCRAVLEQTVPSVAGGC